jgi:hypothetical protein
MLAIEGLYEHLLKREGTFAYAKEERVRSLNLEGLAYSMKKKHGVGGKCS